MKRLLLLARLLLELAILQLSADPKKRSPEDVWILFSQAGALRMELYTFH